MPASEVIFYQELDGSSPMLEWLREIKKRDRRAFADCVARIELLKARGHELRRPHADYLRDGIYELRTRRGSVNYRLLYFFHGRNVAVVSHGLTKEREVPSTEIDRAVWNKAAFEENPDGHIYLREIDDA